VSGGVLESERFVRIEQRVAELERDLSDYSQVIAAHIAYSHGPHDLDAVPGLPTALAPSPLPVTTGEALAPAQEPRPFAPGNRVVVYTTGNPCCKPAMVVAKEGERWRCLIDRAGQIVVSEGEMVRIPTEWR
jgi:hypothetical protein